MKMGELRNWIVFLLILAAATGRLGVAVDMISQLINTGGVSCLVVIILGAMALTMRDTLAKQPAMFWVLLLGAMAIAVMVALGKQSTNSTFVPFGG